MVQKQNVAFAVNIRLCLAMLPCCHEKAWQIGGKSVVWGRFAVQFSFGSTVIRVNIADKAALLAAVAARFAAHQGFALATINIDHLVKLRASPAFRTVYAAQDFVVADGNPIVWLSRLARRPVSLVPGSDMVLPLAQLAAQAGVKVALVGSTTPALQAAAHSLQSQVSGLQITLLHAPAMGFDPEGEASAQVLRDLAAQQIGLCFIALGAPKQEAFAARGRQLAPQTGFASIGAGLDFLAGNQNRAPLWLRKIAMEWLWRALSSPRRMIPRYAACAAILPGQALAALRLR
jgi:N-acetylglucosaminyldiphosphoundecaprenol N-acetyl-beta-D-mannosaminyltransferase